MEGGGRVILLHLESIERECVERDPENQEPKGKLQGASQSEHVTQSKGMEGWGCTT